MNEIQIKKLKVILLIMVKIEGEDGIDFTCFWDLENLNNVLFGCRRSVIVISCGGWPVGGCWNTRAPSPPGTPTSGPPTPRGRAWCWTLMTLPLALGELSPSPSGKGMREGRPHRRGSSQRFLCCLIYYILIIFSCNEKKHNYL